MKVEDTYDFTIKSGNSAAVSHSMKNPEFTISQPKNSDKNLSSAVPEM